MSRAKRAASAAGQSAEDIRAIINCLYWMPEMGTEADERRDANEIRLQAMRELASATLLALAGSVNYSLAEIAERSRLLRGAHRLSPGQRWERAGDARTIQAMCPDCGHSWASHDREAGSMVPGPAPVRCYCGCRPAGVTLSLMCADSRCAGCSLPAAAGSGHFAG